MRRTAIPTSRQVEPYLRSQTLAAKSDNSGFTLLEMVISLMVLSLVAMVMIPLLKMPIEGYFGAQRRAELQAQLSLIQTKLQSDLAKAMPGSLRVQQVGTLYYLEYLEVAETGRYRAGTGGPGYCPATCGGDVFQPACAETCFTSLTPISTPLSLATHYVSVMPTDSANPPAQSNPYSTSGTSPTVSLTSLANVAGEGSGLMFPSHSFPDHSPQKRFYILNYPVTYICNPITGTLTKYYGYALQNTQPTAFAAGVASATLATRISSCTWALTPAGTPTPPQNLRQLLSVQLTLAVGTNGSNLEQTEAALQFAIQEP